MKRFTTWLKKFGWVQTLIAIVAAVAIALLAGKARNTRKRIEKTESTAADLINSENSKKIRKAKQLTESANKDKDKTVEIRQRIEARIEQLGESSEDIDDVASRFNSRRLRFKPSSSGSGLESS